MNEPALAPPGMAALIEEASRRDRLAHEPDGRANTPPSVAGRQRAAAVYAAAASTHATR